MLYNISILGISGRFVVVVVVVVVVAFVVVVVLAKNCAKIGNIFVAIRTSYMEKSKIHTRTKWDIKQILQLTNGSTICLIET